MENKDMIRSIETVSMNAWPALREEFYDGWVLRFSKGYTKRANSVNVLGESGLDLVEKISTCEAAYQREDLAAIFRLTPLSPPDLDGLLESRGYRRLDPTGVMTLDLREWIDPPGEAALLQESSRDAWLAIHGELSSTPLTRQSIHREILAEIDAPCLYASFKQGGTAVNSGLGVLDGPYFGLFDVLTGAAFRNQGFGTRFVAGMLAWAKARYASTAYLQVMEENEPARRLYARLGFQDFYGYWYRVPG